MGPSLSINFIFFSTNYIMNEPERVECKKYILSTMRGSRNFCQGAGGPGQSNEKSSDKGFFFFFFFFLVLSLFYSSQMVNFKEIYHFSRFQRGSNTFQGVSTFFQGIQLLIPYRNPYNL